MAVAVLARPELERLLGQRMPYAVYVLVAAVVGWFAGPLAAGLVFVIGLVVGSFVLVAPGEEWAAAHATRLAIYVGTNVLIVAAARAGHRTRQRVVATAASAEADRQRLAIEMRERERAEAARRRHLADERAARTRAEAAERRARFLAETSRVLGSSLDYDETLAGVARAAVPFLGDWCVIDVCDHEGGVRRVATVAADPRHADLARRIGLQPRGVSGDARGFVVRARQSRFVPRLDDAALMQLARNPDDLAILHAMDCRSVIIVPLEARGQAFGTMTVIRNGESPPYHEDDLALAEDIGRRAGAAIDNARLHAEVQARTEAERRARQEAEAASRAKDEFLATLSHELRTPLTPILSWASLLRRGPLDPEWLARGLAAIERSARAQAKLVDDLLDVARITSGKLQLDVRPVDLRRVVEGALDAMRPAADAKQQAVRIHFPPDPVLVSGDPARLQQVVWNLLSNAVKFTPPAGRVDVVLTREGTDIVLRVHDSGQGMEREFVPHVFDRFRQADASSTRAVGGLGLGLAIVRHLVELHGGTVTATSAGPGQGATFTVRLPEPPPERLVEPAPVLSPSADVAPLEHLRVLLVDDEVETGSALGAVLSDAGADVRTAASVPEALATFDGWQPDVLVSDIAMPGEDGYALIRRVRDRGAARGGDVPAIAVTAFARAEDRERALASGFQAHVAKPLEPATLVNAIAGIRRTGAVAASA